MVVASDQYHYIAPRGRQHNQYDNYNNNNNNINNNDDGTYRYPRPLNHPRQVPSLPQWAVYAIDEPTTHNLTSDYITELFLVELLYNAFFIVDKGYVDISIC